ncbi:MAG: NAD-dependent epimerase/dehydratase family protein, partial [Octadecabacter sp.]|nr:NAD-dependent epimerase/dehydratase family protein [Octadecabacter sp.]
SSLSTALSDGIHTLINLIGVTPNTDDGTLIEDTNVRFVTDLLSCAADFGVAHVVLASSAAVYGTATQMPLRETTPLAPVTAYGRSKARMEDAALEWSTRNNGPALSILRIGNVAGADTLLRSASRYAGHTTMPLHVLPSGSAPVRPYIGPLDFFAALRAIANRQTVAGQMDIFNLAHPVPLALDALLAAYRDQLLPNLSWATQPLPDGTQPEVIFDTTKLSKVIDLPRAPDQAGETARQVALFQSLAREMR